ncbi:Period circadian protein [Temnothorax longispinosus]|uniref:Period circadian protein n=1 Tax=Temnothorax longispinosus TaxID=300112 RepID=A0A4V3S8Z1_9HYME|nr:Period circadian protein [Temnothorax longispinosus]
MMRVPMKTLKTPEVRLGNRTKIHSGSSVSRNSNRSESSGYCTRRPSTFGSSNEALPQPISKRKNKEHKKKKSKAALNAAAEAEADMKTVTALPEIASYNAAAPANTVLGQKPEEVTTVELVDATDPGEHNGDTVADPEAGLASRTVPPDDSTSQANEGFCAVISMHDGLVLYTTPSICTALGYLKDAWIGRSFIDYVHPKDKTTLADQITSGIASPQEESKGINGRRASLFCGLRRFTRYNVLKGYRADARSNLYLPFHLTLSFRDRTAEQQPSNRVMFLVIRLEGSSFRSKPYRFAVQNGGCVVLETEWSSFINPWTKKLEFVVGQHRVLKGPVDPDIFRVSRDTECGYLASISEEVLKEAKIIQGEIRALLDQDSLNIALQSPGKESIQRTSDITEHDVSKRCKDLASFMESLLQETKVPGVGKDGLLAADELRSFSGSRNPLLQEHDSVMLGEISPHHEYYDSKSSTETPPSYNQLNYNENIERFFQSKPPVATMYGSDEENVNSSNDEGARKYMSLINGSGTSGSGSAENLSSGSNNQTSSASRGDVSNTASNSNTTATESFKPPTLTETLLNRHNEDMEKLMMQKHRELRSSIKNSDKLKDSRIKTEKVNGIDQSAHYANQGHGVKRSGSHSWEGDSFKVSKHDKISRTSTAGPANLTTTFTSMNIDQSTVVQTGANINLWPSLSVTMPSSAPTQSCVPSHNTNSEAVPRFPLLPSVIPVYYIPVAQPNESATTMSSSQEKLGPPPSTQPTQQSPYISYVATAMAGVIYPAVIGAPPPRAMMYRPFLIPEQAPAATTRENQQLNDKCPDRKRPASQATSVKAEPGSTMAMSESSKKEKAVSEGLLIMKDHHRPTDYNGDESSSSSFYSSFLYKSSDSSCNPDQKTCEVSSEVENQTAQCPKDVQHLDIRLLDCMSIINVQEYTKCHQGMRRKDPPWLEGVQLTPELIYEYQMHPKTLNEVLKTDLDAMKNFNQPLLVNDQLEQLYLDLEMESFGTKLILEEGMTSSGSDSESSNCSWTESQRKQRRRMVKYGKLMMIHEENAPLPSPLPSQTISYEHS